MADLFGPGFDSLQLHVNKVIKSQKYCIFWLFAFKVLAFMKAYDESIRRDAIMFLRTTGLEIPVLTA